MRPRKCADWNTNRNCCLFLAFGWVSFYFNQRSKLISSTCFSLSQKWAWVGFSDVFFFYNHEEGEALCSFHRKSISISRCQLSLSVLKRKKTTRRGKPVECVCNWARGEYEASLRAGRRLCSNARLSVSNVISTKRDSLLNGATHASQVLFGWRFGYTSRWSDFQAIKFGPFPCPMYAWYNLVLSS